MLRPVGYWLFVVLWLPLGAWADASVWKLADTDVYLAGSIHVLRSSDYPLPIEYDIAYRNADRLVLETDLAAADDLRNQALVAARGIYTDGRTLSRELSDPVYARLSDYLRAKGLPPEQFELYRPWLVMLTLTMIELQANGITAQHGVDRHFYQRARRDGKPVSGLEGIEVQIEALASLGGEFSDELIESQLSDMEQLPEMIDELIASWRVGDETLLNDLLMGDLRDQYPHVYDRVFRQRNRNWLDTLERLIRSGDRVMVVVGSGHLIGEDGLIALLARQGYRFDKLDADG